MESKREKECLRRKRAIQQLGESISEPDLTTADRYYPWIGGYPPGFTVDELHWFRKKPGNWGPQDNLKIQEGSMKKFKTEYSRCYKPYNFVPSSNEDITSTSQDANRRGLIRPHDFIKLEGDLVLNPEYKDLYSKYPYQKRVFTKPKSQLEVESGAMDVNSEQHDKYISPQGATRAPLARRSSSLQREGEFMVKASEMHSQFVKYNGAKRADLTRRPTSLRLEGDMAVTSETAGKFIEYLIDQRSDLVKAPNNLKLEGTMAVETEKSSQYIPFELPKRVPLTKQHTNLHLEGPMEIQSEKQDKFGPYNLQQRRQLVKHDTNLHLEGEMDILTENRAKYIPYELSIREKFTKRPTNLHLEGEMDIQTEKNSKYIPFEVQKRPPLVKKDTNLHLEGSLVMTPEYRDEYIEYASSERPTPKRPVNNLGLQSEPDLENKKDNFFAKYQKPFRSFDSKLRPDGTHEISPTFREHSKRSKENVLGDFIPDGQLKVAEKKTKVLDSLPIADINKYNNVSFPRERPKVMRSGEETNGVEIKQKRTRNYAQPIGNLKTEGQFESNPEYRSSYVDFPRERPIVRKPSNSLKTEGNVSHLSEKEAQYIEHSYAPRPPLARREDELKMEGRFECQPEYRKAYIDFLQRENITRKTRPFDNLSTGGQHRAFDVMCSTESSEDSGLQKGKLTVPSLKDKPRVVKSPRGYSSSDTNGKSHSVSPDRRRKTRQVPRTPRQERVLVPDMSGLSPRRPSSIFGPKTGRWSRPCSPSCPPCCPEDIPEPTSLKQPELLHPCSRDTTKWKCPCGKREYCRCPPRTPSPRRVEWSEPQIREEKPASFVVLSDKVEINNNRLKDRNDRVYTSSNKEQKWMPPWYETPK